MTAQEQMRAMLDQLMGTGRDGENNKFKVTFDNPRVCKSFLLSCCPHDILASTRMDLGECPKIHDLALRADYATAQEKKDHFYDIDAVDHLSMFIADCDRRTEQAKKRLKETQEDLSEEANVKAERIHGVGEQIGIKLAKAEELGALGEVEESMKLMSEVDDLKKEKGAAENDYRNSMPASTYQQQKLRVCEVCSAYLGIHDNDRRLADHFGGKLHLGFIEIREKLADLMKDVTERRVERDRLHQEKRVEREKERERGKKDRDRSKSRSPSRKRRSRSRDRKKRHRSRSRSRSRRHRSRSRSRRRHRRSRSRSRSRRSRRSKRSSRSRSKTRRSRSGSRSKHSKRLSRSPSKEKITASEENNVNPEHEETEAKKSADENNELEST